MLHLNLLYYAIYAILNAIAMMAIKLAFKDARNRSWSNSVKNILICGVLYTAAISLLIFLLSKYDAIVVFPTAIGFTVIATNIIDYYYFYEKINPNKVLGTGMILVGIILIYLN